MCRKLHHIDIGEWSRMDSCAAQNITDCIVFCSFAWGGLAWSHTHQNSGDNSAVKNKIQGPKLLGWLYFFLDLNNDFHDKELVISVCSGRQRECGD